MRKILDNIDLWAPCIYTPACIHIPTPPPLQTYIFTMHKHIQKQVTKSVKRTAENFGFSRPNLHPTEF